MEHSHTDLRITAKLVQLLRRDHGVQVSYRASNLPALLLSHIETLNDPVLLAMWEGLSVQFKTTAKKMSLVTAESSTRQKDRSDREKMYRGVSVEMSAV